MDSIERDTQRHSFHSEDYCLQITASSKNKAQQKLEEREEGCVDGIFESSLFSHMPSMCRRPFRCHFRCDKRGCSGSSGIRRASKRN
jgi:hypothetical protein